MGASGADSSVAEGPHRLFSPGDTVQIYGLESETGKQLNGQSGVITRYLEQKDRFELRLPEGIAPVPLINLKPENIRCPDAGIESLTAQEPIEDTAQSTSLGQDINVTASSVEAEEPKKAPGRSRNLEEHERGRPEDSVPSQVPSNRGDGRRPKQQPTLEPGDVVEVHGLQSDSGRLLNGLRAEVQRFVESSGRFEVMFQRGAAPVELSSLKAENLRKIPLAARQNQNLKRRTFLDEPGPRAAPEIPPRHAWLDEAKSVPSPARPVLKPRFPEEKSEQPMFVPGDEVEISMRDDPLSGERGHVVRLENSRVQVTLSHGSETLTLRPENLLLRRRLVAGDIVEVANLESEAGRQRNGRLGTVSHFVAEQCRFEVVFREGNAVVDRMRLKPKNLREPPPVPAPPDELETEEFEESRPFGPGDRVEIAGLTSASGRKMNGRQGTVTQYVESKGRFEVKVAGTDELLSLKPENMKDLLPGVVDPKPMKNLRRPFGEDVHVDDLDSFCDLPDRDGTDRFQDGPDSLGPGSFVEVVGLESDAGRRINGQRGSIKEYSQAKDRFEVLLLSGKTVSLKFANLREVSCDDGTPSPGGLKGFTPNLRSAFSDKREVEEAAAATNFVPGHVVEVSGLESEFGKALNWQRGVVTRYLTDNGRFEVRFAHGKLVSLSPVHLARLDVQVDDMVQVVGLESEGGRQFNGQRGVVLRFIEDTSRFEVRLGSNPVALRPENLRRVDW